MSFHSLLEGLALGVQQGYNEILSLFVSLILHKGIEAFSVGLQVCRLNPQRLPIVAADFNQVAKSGTIVVIEAIAVGTFVYVTFLEFHVPEVLPILAYLLLSINSQYRKLFQKFIYDRKKYIKWGQLGCKIITEKLIQGF
ncbi:unnamed protein product [Enterobius vermicularis]|uniref:ABC transmembrane type-1 domain-containing protein n=1 Tax=Enterobius vermicularis TaxID=51028 RepID=A0A0N4V8C1_ENTVE|nr:unnamed protein product [Enterobius vermicularis]